MVDVASEASATAIERGELAGGGAGEAGSVGGAVASQASVVTGDAGVVCRVEEIVLWAG